MHQCYYCGGEQVEQPTTFVYEDEDQFWVVRNVPALVCTRCGEKEYHPRRHPSGVDAAEAASDAHGRFCMYRPMSWWRLSGHALNDNPRDRLTDRVANPLRARQ